MESTRHPDSPHLDAYCLHEAEDFAPEPPDPFWEPPTRFVELFGPLDSPASSLTTDASHSSASRRPRRYAEFHDPSGLLPSYEIYQGDAVEVLRLLAQQAVVHAVVTSPAYFKLRRYGDRPEELGWGSLDRYLASLCDVFDAVPLHRRGSAWVNLGDSRDRRGNLLLVPERFAAAMLERGWLIADKVVWAKAVARTDGTVEGHCMTEPTPGRLNGNAHEALYRFVRGRDHPRGGLGRIQKAWADPCALGAFRGESEANSPATRYLPESLVTVTSSVEGRALPNVWRVPMGQTRAGHFAVFPPALAERPIAMTAPMSVCALCGRPRERLVERVTYDDGRGPRRMGKYRAADALGAEEAVARSGRQDIGRTYVPRKPVTTGWSACPCGWEWMPGTVLDPFAGTSSVGYSALLMGRNYIGIDLYSENCRLSRERCCAAIDLLRGEGLLPHLLQR